MFISKLIIFISAILFILTGCTSTISLNTAPRDIVIFISGAPFAYNTVFELVDEYTFEVASTPTHITWGSSNNDTRETELRHSIIGLISSNVIDRGYFEVSENNANAVWGLIENVAANEPDRYFQMTVSMSNVIFDFADGIYVRAIIDGTRYWSVFHPDIDNAPEYWLEELHQYVNRDLLLLTYKLMDLSPIQVLAERESS